MICQTCGGRVRYLYTVIDEGQVVSAFTCPICQLFNEFRPPAAVFCPVCDKTNVLFIAGQDGADYHCFDCDNEFELSVPFGTDESDEGDPDGETQNPLKRNA